MVKLTQFSKKNNQSAFSLVEVLLAASILVVAIFVLIELFTYCSPLANSAGNMGIAINEAQKILEEIKNTNFDSIATNYASGGTPGNTFNISQPTGKGVIYLDTSNADLIRVDVVICWQNANGRVIGEDKDLDGLASVSEDVNGNGQVDSPVTLSSFIARR